MHAGIPVYKLVSIYLSANFSHVISPAVKIVHSKIHEANFLHADHVPTLLILLDAVHFITK